MTGPRFQIAVQVQASPEFPGLLELSVSRLGALALVLAMSREHYSSSCVVLAGLAMGLSPDILPELIYTTSGLRPRTKEGKEHLARVREIVADMISEGHLVRRSPVHSYVDGELITVSMAPIEFDLFARDADELKDRVPESTAKLMDYLAKAAEYYITPDQRLLSLLAEEPVVHDRGN